MGNLHFVDSQKVVRDKKHPDYDPLAKIRPMLDVLRVNLQQLWTPGQDLTVDESMVKCKNRW